MSDLDDELAKLGCERLARSARGQVAIASAIREDFDAIEEKKRARLTRIMELWCDGRPLTEEMFNGNEGRTPKSNLMLQAFKGFKIRLYGFVRQVRSVKTFIVVDMDLAKSKIRPILACLKEQRTGSKILEKEIKMEQQKTHERGAIFAEEALVVDVQAFLHRMMLEKKVSRSELAQAMGVSKARITQIFSDDCKNFTIRLLARAVHALGEQVEITSPCCDQLDTAEAEADAERRSLIAASANVTSIWRNENEDEERRFEQSGIMECPPGDKRLSAVLNSLGKATREVAAA